jgi:hypothetical protein
MLVLTRLVLNKRISIRINILIILNISFASIFYLLGFIRKINLILLALLLIIFIFFQTF